MTCRHCHQHIVQCDFQAIHGVRCQGWIHSSNTMHLCRSDDFLSRDMADPEPVRVIVHVSKPPGEAL